MPPNVSVPILDLVDVIFQLQDGGWIRYLICLIVELSLLSKILINVDLMSIFWVIMLCIAGDKLSGWPNKSYN